MLHALAIKWERSPVLVFPRCVGHTKLTHGVIPGRNRSSDTWEQVPFSGQRRIFLFPSYEE